MIVAEPDPVKKLCLLDRELRRVVPDLSAIEAAMFEQLAATEQ